ncbi:hypothetical protein K490DRAFT_44214 [Saccharata proteae CBS 121410]|uniref:Histone-lysine N-methyltransferase SET9 n=1 Tax=Saccharata proteae CBS 121410 TaxID=1314787 RepID=A0A9P4HU87_9PEZI|nr:hypothetical protein K490DRAFT_44214 [Saccharata proteae CBS 121410]
MALKDALAKKGGLTLSQLANYDDLATDALVDRTYFWTSIRKNRARYFGCRGLNEEEIAALLRDTVIIGKDPAKAVERLLVEQSGLRKFFQKLRTKDEKEHFRRHLRKYVSMYMPECAWEVATTNRYTITTHEAAIFARRHIRKNEPIKYLTGIQVSMTKEEEETLDLTRRDFSIVMSSRKKTPSLFMGPARFANHDCKANARLTTEGAHTMTIVSTRPIEMGEEITVSYGDDYFGEDNCECLCATCEKLRRNGWGPKLVKTEDEDMSEMQKPPQEAPYTFRRKRKYCEDSESQSREITNEPIKKERIESQLSREFHADDEFDVAGQTRFTATFTRSTRDFRVQKRSGLLGVAIEESESFGSGSPGALSDESPPSSQLTDMTSVDEDTAPTTPEEPFSGYKITEKLAESIEDLGSAEAKDIHVKAESVALIHGEGSQSTTESELSDLSDSFELDDALQAVVVKKRVPTPPRTRSRSKPTIAPAPIPTTEHSDSNCPRQPGDYTLTSLLLCAKYSRWVVCGNCEADFVQEDAYQTRAECPRCERHSKLYGYVWPKTEKEGRHDTEERVLDHRTVNRFVGPEDERAIKKSKTALESEIQKRRASEMSERARMGSEAHEDTPKRATRKKSRLALGSM